ncbi:hypothetical protein [Paenibacillus xerothermodurans]|uniref:DUF3888 domain-containing protein n=1 Tax=Paenibacillus xerothermodurans TaxID=1977292 RepID=A0A2W1NAM2_PAEXE|nr:hypothetical protein [Paenibacillus xerothermodurans]PZE20251.1 hypothetical protein CBW46_013955 [Paenibacillus xerothermodurans]
MHFVKCSNVRLTVRLAIWAQFLVSVFATLAVGTTTAAAPAIDEIRQEARLKWERSMSADHGEEYIRFELYDPEQKAVVFNGQIIMPDQYVTIGTFRYRNTLFNTPIRISAGAQGDYTAITLSKLSGYADPMPESL